MAERRQQLGKDAVLFDEVAEDFVLCDDPEAAAYTSDYAADGTWKDPVPAEGVTITCDAKKNTVSVTGFDYSADYVTKNGHVDRSGFYGRKLIVTFRIRPLAAFGGNGVETNTGRSGVYPDGTLKNPTGLFPIPKVDIPLSYEIDGRDKNVFAPDAVTLPELAKYRTGFVPDGKNNRRVSITYEICDSAGTVLQTMQIPAGKTSEEVRFGDPKAEVPKRCAKYTIRCTVTPVTEGTQKGLTRKKTQSVHYFVPTVDLKDTEEKKGDAIDTKTGELLSGKDLGSHLVSLTWACCDGTKAGEKSAPDLAYRVSALSGVTVQNGTEVLSAEEAAAFDVRVFRIEENALGEEVTELSNLTHSCEREDCSFSSVREREPQADFLIHTGSDDAEETEDGKKSSKSNSNSASGTGGTAKSDAGAEADADSTSSVTNNVTIENNITVPSGSTGVVQSAASPTPAASSDAVQEANRKAAEATLQANLKAAEDAQNAILKAQQDAAAQNSDTEESTVTAVTSSTPAASSAQVITDRPKTGEAGDADLFVPIAAAAGALFLVLTLCFVRDVEEQIIMALAEQLLSEFSRTELRTFLASSPMGVEMRDCSLGVHRLEGEEHLLAEVPDMGLVDLYPFFLRAGMPVENAEMYRRHPDGIRISQMKNERETAMVVTLYADGGEELERTHLRNQLVQLIEMTGCYDLETLRNGILDAAEAANLPPDFPILF